MEYLSIQNITKKFGGSTVLKDVSIQIGKGEFVCVLGPSGCGKSTLLRIVSGLEEADHGAVFVAGSDYTQLPPSRRNMGIVFQSYALFPNLTVRQNIEYGLKRKTHGGKTGIDKVVSDVVGLVGLGEHIDKYPRQLSGGQQQRTALARVLALTPDFLLLDEPLSALDAKVRQQLRGEIRSLQQKLGITTIMVTHDQEEALTMADKIVVMNQAVIEQIGTPEEIYKDPATPFVADFVGTINLIENASDLYGIRPENIVLSLEKCKVRPDGPHIDAVVQSVEYKGSMTRIYAASLRDDRVLCADIGSEQCASWKLRSGMNIFMTLPEKHIKRYKTSVAV